MLLYLNAEVVLSEKLAGEDAAPKKAIEVRRGKEDELSVEEFEKKGEAPAINALAPRMDNIDGLAGFFAELEVVETPARTRDGAEPGSEEDMALPTESDALSDELTPAVAHLGISDSCEDVRQPASSSPSPLELVRGHVRADAHATQLLVVEETREETQLRLLGVPIEVDESKVYANMEHGLTASLTFLAGGRTPTWVPDNPDVDDPDTAMPGQEDRDLEGERTPRRTWTRLPEPRRSYGCRR